MYLSRITLSLSERTALNISADRYIAHQFVTAAFQDPLPARPLYRVILTSDRPQLLVQSRLRPDWARAIGPRHFQAVCEVKEIPKLNLATGQLLRFLLMANAVRTIRPEAAVGAQKRGRAVRVPLIREEHLLEWLRRQGERGGFRLRSVRVVPERERVEMRALRGRAPIVLCGAEFQGVVEVTKPDAFWSTVENGIGHGKGFGFGLLSVAPLGRGDGT